MGLFAMAGKAVSDWWKGDEKKPAAPAAGGDPAAAAAPAGAAPAAAGPGAEKKPAKTGAAAVADSLADEQKALADLSKNAGGDGASQKELEDKKQDLQARIDANNALKDKFKIVDGEPGKDAGPNVMTREQYEKVVKQYSDISQGKGDIKIDTAGMSEEEAKKFKEGTMADIGSILQTKEGRDMLGKLQDNTGSELDSNGKPVHKSTTIGQSYKPEWVPDPNRPGEFKVNEDAKGNTVYATDPNTGKKIPSPDDCLNEPADPSADPERAIKDDKGKAGLGMDARAMYTPGQDAMGTRSDVALFHELKHAHDMTTGQMDYSDVDASSGVPKDAAGGVRSTEHQAVGLGNYKDRATNPWTENAYREARNKIGEGDTGVREGDKGMEQRQSYV